MKPSAVDHGTGVTEDRNTGFTWGQTVVLYTTWIGIKRGNNYLLSCYRKIMLLIHLAVREYIPG